MVRRLKVWGWLCCISGVALGAGCGARASSSHESGGSPGQSAGGTGQSAGDAGQSAGSPGQSVGGTGQSAGNGGSNPHVAGSGAVAGSSANSGGGAPAQAGAPSTGGSNASGAGGATPTDTASPASVHVVCSALCDQLGRCPDGKGSLGSSCNDQCFNVVYMNNSTSCTATGEDMMACLTAADRADLPACADAFALAVQKCSQKVAAYQACASTGAGAAPASYFCVQVSNNPGQAHSCTEERKCLNGDLYSITCSDTSNGQSSCSCQAPTETKTFTVNDVTPDACTYHQCISL